MRPINTSTIKEHFSVNTVNVSHSKNAIKFTLKFTLLPAIEKDRYGLQKTVLKHVNLPLYYRYDEGKYSPRKQVLTVGDQQCRSHHLFV